MQEKSGKLSDDFLQESKKLRTRKIERKHFLELELENKGDMESARCLSESGISIKLFAEK
jgi:hypothetical protein